MDNENQSTPPQHRPISEKQVTFLTSLANSRDLDEADKDFVLQHMGEFDVKLASKWIDALKVLPPKPKQQVGKWAIPQSIPDGRYALVNSNKVWVFFRIVTRDNVRDGIRVRIVQKVLGSPGAFRYVRVNSDEWNLAINTIVKDPAHHSTLFGLKIGACGVCGSPLTDPQSIRLGIGPICLRKMNWDVEDDNVAEDSEDDDDGN